MYYVKHLSKGKLRTASAEELRALRIDQVEKLRLNKELPLWSWVRFSNMGVIQDNLRALDRAEERMRK